MNNKNINELKNLDLPNVTLVAFAGKKIYATVRALEYSTKKINYGRVLLISHKKPWYLPKNIDFEYTSKSKSMYEWCYKIIYKLHEYIKTDYIILVHSDGFVVNPESWKNSYLDYDYIGAPWPIPEDDSYLDENKKVIRVGNSVSLRSKRILELPSILNLPWEPPDGFYHEDGFLCCNVRNTLIRHGIKYAPLEVAKYFSHESMIPEIAGISPFAFHKWHGSNSGYPGKWINRLLP